MGLIVSDEQGECDHYIKIIKALQAYFWENSLLSDLQMSIGCVKTCGSVYTKYGNYQVRDVKMHL